MKRRLIHVLAATVVATPLSTEAAILDFEGLGLFDWEPIPASYGAGLDPNVRLRFQTRAGYGETPTVWPGLHWWEAEYGDLSGVAWGWGDRTDADDHVGEITFVADRGWLVHLASLDAAGWQGDQDGRSLRVYDRHYNLLWSTDPMTIPGDPGVPGEHASLLPDVATRVLRLQWNDPWHVGVDNILFASQPNVRGANIPAPSVPALLLVAGGLLGVRRYRRH